MKCIYCNTELNRGDVYCYRCGNRVADSMDKTTGSDTGKSNMILIGVIAGLVIIIMFLVFKFIIFSDKNISLDQVNPQSSSAQRDTISQDVTGTNEEGSGVSDNNQAIDKQQYAPPVFTSIEVSSTRGTDVSSRGEVVDYNKYYLMDGIMWNCWTPNRHYDYAPFIILRADSPQRVNGIRFTDGYFKSMETYTRNRRIATVEILYNGGSMIYVCREHVFGKMQDVVFPYPVDTDFIRINIKDTLYGDWLDICVSEIAVY